jgi:phosphoglycerate kinase
MKKTIRDFNYQNKKVLVRVDFNVPLEDGKVADDTRIKAALPTINYLLEQNAAVILCSHLGRPNSEVKPALSLKPTAEHLDSLIDAQVKFVDETIGDRASGAVDQLNYGEVLVLENTRFLFGEKRNLPETAKGLADLADLFVNDAFGTAHRAHASNVGVAEYLPSAAGFLLEKEIKFLDKLLSNPEKPFVVILGGAKIGDKIGVIKNLLEKADHVLVGGGMANTFFKAQGYQMGDSLVEDDVLDIASDLLVKGSQKIHLPIDVVIADGFSNDASRKVISTGNVPEGWRILDIGPETVNVFGNRVVDAGTVVWNGPMGVFEFPEFAAGTFALAAKVAECRGVTIIGGGDSAAAVIESGLADKFTHISTGGGASLQMLEGKELPGLAVLDDIQEK